MSNWMFVGAAFAVTWGTLLGYFSHLRGATHRAQQMAESMRMQR
jgi:hypothetical protein